MSTEPLVLGIDLATANARVVAVGIESGRTLCEVHAPLPRPHSSAPGWSEQDPQYAAVALGLIKEITAALGPASANIRALSTTGTSGTVVPTGTDGRPMSSAIMYNDQRALRENSTIAELNPHGPYAALARSAWLERNAPADRYLNTPDIVNAALAGRIVASDTSHSLKSAIDVQAGTWDLRLLEALELPEAKMGVLTAPATSLAEVSTKQASELGLPGNVQIVAGMTDGCTAQIAAGAVREGDVVGVLGTTLVLKSVALSNVTSSDYVVYSHRSPDGHYWPGGASNVGAGVLTSRLGILPEQLDARNADAARHGPASGISYPLNGVGERFPFQSATASFFLESSGASAIDEYRAILEGIAFTERLGVERLTSLGVEPKRFLVTGGGSASSAWNSIRATVLGHAVHRPQSHNSAFGAAMIAAASLTGESLTTVSERLVSIDASFEPDTKQAQALEESYQRFVSELRRRGYF